MVNSTQVVYGGSMMIFINPTGTTAAGALGAAFSTNAKITISLSDREISSKDSGDWSEFLGNKFSWTVTTDALLSLSGVTGSTLSTKKVFTAFVSKTPVYVAFSVTAGTSPSWTIATNKLKFTGTALINSMDLTAADNAEAVYTFAAKGTGALSIG
jgi:predicted secreted protein